MLRNLLTITLLCFFSAVLCAQRKDTLTENFSSPENCIFKEGGNVSQKYFLDGGSSYCYSTIFKPLGGGFYRISTSVEFLDGSSSRGYGLSFEGSGVENTNVFLVSNSGYFMTGFYQDGKFSNILPWQKSDFIKKDSVNILEIARENNLTRFYINGGLVFQTSKVKAYGFRHGYFLKSGVKISSDFFRIITYKDKYVFTTPKKTLAEVNSQFPDIAPLESDDGKTLYFSRIDAPENYGPPGDCDIWFAEKDNYMFSSPVHFPYKVNGRMINAVIKTADKNHTLYVEGTYDESGIQESSNGISVTKKLTDLYWTVPKKIEIKNFYNNNKHGTYAFSSDFKVLILSVERKDSYGGLDLYASFLNPDGSYSEPVNLGQKVNTKLDDGTPFLSPDGRMLYFSSYGHKGFGGSDIFVSKRLDDSYLKWSCPENLGSMVNTKNWEAYFSVSADFSTAYFVSNDNEDFDENIYTIGLPEELGPSEDIVLTIAVADKITKEAVEAVVSVKTGASETKAVRKAKGSFSAETIRNRSLTVEVCAKNYKTLTVNFEHGIGGDSTFTAEISPEKLRLKSLSFYFRSAVLMKSDYPELDRLAEYLNENPEIKILLCGHTEKGHSDISQALSEMRASSVKNYLTEKGVNGTRISCKGFSGKQPLSHGNSAADRAKNRRVEVVLIFP